MKKNILLFTFLFLTISPLTAGKSNKPVINKQPLFHCLRETPLPCLVGAAACAVGVCAPEATGFSAASLCYFGTFSCLAGVPCLPFGESRRRTEEEQKERRESRKK